jgi:SOS-response transcriptional repressor LexA
MSIGDRIRQVRQANGLTQKAFAESLGIVQGFLSNIERGKNLPSDTFLIALTHVYQIDKQWLSSGKGGPHADTSPSHERSPVSENDTLLLKQISPEFPHDVKPEDILGHVSLPGTTPDSYALVAYGEFMAPTIQDNDLVLFSLSREAEHGDIVLVNSKWGDVILRRYRIKDDGGWLSPDNMVYSPFQTNSKTQIIGVVTGIWRKVKF